MVVHISTNTEMSVSIPLMLVSQFFIYIIFSKHIQESLTPWTHGTERNHLLGALMVPVSLFYAVDALLFLTSYTRIWGTIIRQVYYLIVFVYCYNPRFFGEEYTLLTNEISRGSIHTAVEIPVSLLVTVPVFNFIYTVNQRFQAALRSLLILKAWFCIWRSKLSHANPRQFYFLIVFTFYHIMSILFHVFFEQNRSNLDASDSDGWETAPSSGTTTPRPESPVATTEPLGEKPVATPQADIPDSHTSQAHQTGQSLKGTRDSILLGIKADLESMVNRSIQQQQEQSLATLQLIQDSLKRLFTDEIRILQNSLSKSLEDLKNYVNMQQSEGADPRLLMQTQYTVSDYQNDWKSLHKLRLKNKLRAREVHMPREEYSRLVGQDYFTDEHDIYQTYDLYRSSDLSWKKLSLQHALEEAVFCEQQIERWNTRHRVTDRGTQTRNEMTDRGTQTDIGTEDRGTQTETGVSDEDTQLVKILDQGQDHTPATQPDMPRPTGHIINIDELVGPISEIVSAAVRKELEAISSHVPYTSHIQQIVSTVPVGPKTPMIPLAKNIIADIISYTPESPLNLVVPPNQSTPIPSALQIYSDQKPSPPEERPVVEVDGEEPPLLVRTPSTILQQQRPPIFGEIPTVSPPAQNLYSTGPTSSQPNTPVRRTVVFADPLYTYLMPSVDNIDMTNQDPAGTDNDMEESLVSGSPTQSHQDPAEKSVDESENPAFPVDQHVTSDDSLSLQAYRDPQDISVSSSSSSDSSRSFSTIESKSPPTSSRINDSQDPSSTDLLDARIGQLRISIITEEKTVENEQGGQSIPTGEQSDAPELDNTTYDVQVAPFTPLTNRIGFTTSADLEMTGISDVRANDEGVGNDRSSEDSMKGVEYIPQSSALPVISNPATQEVNDDGLNNLTNSFKSGLNVLNEYADVDTEMTTIGLISSGDTNMVDQLSVEIDQPMNDSEIPESDLPMADQENASGDNVQNSSELGQVAEEVTRELVELRGLVKELIDTSPPCFNPDHSQKSIETIRIDIEQRLRTIAAGDSNNHFASSLDKNELSNIRNSIFDKAHNLSCSRNILNATEFHIDEVLQRLNNLRSGCQNSKHKDRIRDFIENSAPEWQDARLKCISLATISPSTRKDLFELMNEAVNQYNIVKAVELTRTPQIEAVGICGPDCQPLTASNNLEQPDDDEHKEDSPSSALTEFSDGVPTTPPPLSMQAHVDQAISAANAADTSKSSVRPDENEEEPKGPRAKCQELIEIISAKIYGYAVGVTIEPCAHRRHHARHETWMNEYNHFRTATEEQNRLLAQPDADYEAIYSALSDLASYYCNPETSSLELDYLECTEDCRLPSLIEMQAMYDSYIEIWKAHDSTFTKPSCNNLDHHTAINASNLGAELAEIKGRLDNCLYGLKALDEYDMNDNDVARLVEWLEDVEELVAKVDTTVLGHGPKCSIQGAGLSSPPWPSPLNSPSESSSSGYTASAAYSDVSRSPTFGHDDGNGNDDGNDGGSGSSRRSTRGTYPGQPGKRNQDQDDGDGSSDASSTDDTSSEKPPPPPSHPPPSHIDEDGNPKPFPVLRPPKRTLDATSDNPSFKLPLPRDQQTTSNQFATYGSSPAFTPINFNPSASQPPPYNPQPGSLEDQKAKLATALKTRVDADRFNELWSIISPILAKLAPATHLFTLEKLSVQVQLELSTGLMNLNSVRDIRFMRIATLNTLLATVKRYYTLPPHQETELRRLVEDFITPPEQRDTQGWSDLKGQAGDDDGHGIITESFEPVRRNNEPDIPPSSPAVAHVRFGLDGTSDVEELALQPSPPEVVSVRQAAPLRRTAMEGEIEDEVDYGDSEIGTDASK